MLIRLRQIRNILAFRSMRTLFPCGTSREGRLENQKQSVVQSQNGEGRHLCLEMACERKSAQRNSCSFRNIA